jgi:hypothetical protein
LIASVSVLTSRLRRAKIRTIQMIVVNNGELRRPVPMQE